MDGTVPQHAPKDGSAHQQVILVVDARPMRQFYTSISLQRLGYQVIMAKTAEDALLFLGLTVPLVIIANHDLPKMTGLEFLTLVRRDHRTRGVPVIIYTSNRSPEVKKDCEDAGCSAFLRHPCSLEGGGGDGSGKRHGGRRYGHAWINLEHPASSKGKTAGEAAKDRRNRKTRRSKKELKNMSPYKVNKTIAEINEKIRKGKAVVVTAEEIIGIVEEKGPVKAALEGMW